MSDNQTQPEKKFEIPPELGRRLLEGNITVGEFLGLSQRTLYAIATIGHQMLKGGNFSGARDVFEGLIAAAPYDSVFRTHLAAALANLEEYDAALGEYTQAINFNYANSDALTGRGELLLRAKRVPEAIRDLQAAVKYDPEGKRASTQRAKTILTLMERAAKQPEAPAPAKKPDKSVEKLVAKVKAAEKAPEKTHAKAPEKKAAPAKGKAEARAKK